MRLSKYHGLGNDFLVLVDVDGSQPADADLARRVCDRHRGIGADGLIRTRRGDTADLVMELWNADGSRAEMSGNGIRCLAHAAVDAGLVSGPVITVATDAGLKTLTRIPRDDPGQEWFSVEMGAAKVTRLDDGEAEVDMGNPHLVILDDEQTKDLLALGHEHPDVNVELVGGQGQNITMRVWERGVGETLACGTGAGAAAAAMHAWGRTAARVTVGQPGGDAEVELVGDIVVLIGPSQHIADIEVATS